MIMYALFCLMIVFVRSCSKRFDHGQTAGSDMRQGASLLARHMIRQIILKFNDRRHTLSAAFFFTQNTSFPSFSHFPP